MANNEVRIIGGQWKGRKIRFPRREGLRPTLGRVRETLFNWLGPAIGDAHCLDLYAGSGALGFEALSRGAGRVTFVERDAGTARALRANIRALEARARVVPTSARRFLAGNRARYQIIFFDPPFADPGARDLLKPLLAEHLEEDGLLYLEMSGRVTLPETDRVLKQGKAGDCTFALLGPAAGQLP